MHITKHFSFQARPNQHIPIIAYAIEAVPICRNTTKKIN